MKSCSGFAHLDDEKDEINKIQCILFHLDDEKDEINKIQCILVHVNDGGWR